MIRHETNLRHDARTTAGFLRWARGATYGEFCVYHTGRLSTDRRDRPEINRLADTVLLLQDTGWINATQYRRAIDADIQYIATRTGAGYAPRSIMREEITAGDWRILHAIREVRHGRSITRIIRDIAQLGASDKAAAAILERFKISGWVEPEPAVAGWQISPLGLSLLV